MTTYGKWTFRWIFPFWVLSSGLVLGGKQINQGPLREKVEQYYGKQYDESLIRFSGMLNLFYFHNKNLRQAPIFDPITNSSTFVLQYPEHPDPNYTYQAEYGNLDNEVDTITSYPKRDYIRVCILGIGDMTVAVLERLILSFPQFTFVIYDTDYDVNYLQYLYERVGTQRLNLELRESLNVPGEFDVWNWTHPRAPIKKDQCTAVFFGQDSERFSFRKIEHLSTTGQPMILGWLTGGCDARHFAGEPIPHEAKERCKYQYSLWRNSMCGNKEDIIGRLSGGQAGESAEEVRSSFIDGPAIFGAYGDTCYNHVLDAYGEDGFDIKSPLCLCALHQELITDIIYEDTKCDQFASGILPEGRRILVRNDENWYNPDRDWFFGFSQWNQDWYLYHNLFKHKLFEHKPLERNTLLHVFDMIGEFDGRKHGGTFVDIGAMGAYELSNTVVFERCFGWTGICVEPNPQHYHSLLNYRTCKVVNKCVGGGNMEMTEAKKKAAAENGEILEAERTRFGLDFSGSIGLTKQMSEHELIGKAENLPDEAARRLLRHSFEVECMSLDELLFENGANIKTPIDLISIDVEGAEFAILEHFPFDKYNIYVFLIEVDAEHILRMDIIMFIANYVKFGIIGKDQVYVHQKYLKLLTKLFFMYDPAENNNLELFANPFRQMYPPYLSVHPYSDPFPAFQRRFLDPKFGS